MNTLHQYQIETNWKGNRGTGTSALSDYDRIHSISNGAKPELELTTDDATYGNKAILNPEDLLVSAASSCHMMSYLYLCAKAKVVVTSYRDRAIGIMEEFEKGGGKFISITLKPECEVEDGSMIEKALKLHHQAGEICFIAASLNFPVHHEPIITVRKR